MTVPERAEAREPRMAGKSTALIALIAFVVGAIMCFSLHLIRR